MVLLKVFSRTFHTQGSLKNPIRKVAVIGAGQMGTGISQVTAQNGHQVCLMDRSLPQINRARRKIEESLGKLAKLIQAKYPEQSNVLVTDTLRNMTFSLKLEEALQSADLVIEAVNENLPKKRELFFQVEQMTSKSTLMATCTSILRISEVMDEVQNKYLCGGLHFFYPVPKMELVEVVRIEETSNRTFQSLLQFCKVIGKTPIVCKDLPGFVVYRLLIPYMIEAMHMVERGEASVRDIDTAMRLGAGHPMGPFELADSLGLDTAKNMLEISRQRDPSNPLFQPIPLLDKMLEEGKFGVKSDEGFYTYQKRKEHL